MKKLHSFTFYAMVTPVIALGAGSLLAQPAAGQNADPATPAAQSAERAQQGTQRDQTATPAGQRDQTAAQPGGQNADRAQPGAQRDPNASQPANRTSQSEQNTQRAGQPGSPAAAGQQNASELARNQNRGFLNAAPANGMTASDLIGAEVMATGGDEVGPVEDLIIDENGQVVAIIIGVGGFLGLAEKNVAIGWDDVTRSGIADEQELRIDVTREQLSSAPELVGLD